MAALSCCLALAGVSLSAWLAASVLAALAAFVALSALVPLAVVAAGEATVPGSLLVALIDMAVSLTKDRRRKGSSPSLDYDRIFKFCSKRLKTQGNFFSTMQFLQE